MILFDLLSVKVFLLFIGLLSSIPVQAENVWDVMRSQFRLDHETTQAEVQTQLRWLASHPSYLHKLARSEPYMYHIVNEIKKRGMPGEIALLPMIESAYDPFAYSGAGAAGLWQLMPGTGSNLGLKQDWWFDARRSIRPSTNAALNYLSYLNRFFHGNWILAIAAYDSGEGTIARAIKRSGQSGRTIRFWSLPVPSETKAYIPRLLALAEIIKYPQRYRITLPDIPHAPYFEEVNIGSQIDLNHAAKLAGISFKDLIQLNPGFNRWTTAPYKPFKLLIPATKVAKFNRNLANMPKEKRVSWRRYQVRRGDSLNSIAQRNFTTIKLLRELNQLESNALTPGQYVLIPSTNNVAIAARPSKTMPFKPPLMSERIKVIHIVQRGESYPLLETKYHVSKKEICQWNDLKPHQPLRLGKALILWKKTIKHGIYRVRAGDTLSAIAKRHQMKIQALVQLNPGLNTQRLHPGQKIII